MMVPFGGTWLEYIRCWKCGAGNIKMFIEAWMEALRVSTKPMDHVQKHKFELLFVSDSFENKGDSGISGNMLNSPRWYSMPACTAPCKLGIPSVETDYA